MYCRSLALALLCTSLVAMSPAASGAQLPEFGPHALLEDERNTIAVFQEASESVVYIANKLRQRRFLSMNVTEVQRGTGSGFLWDDRGHIVTNYHVLQGGNTFYVTLAGGATYLAQFIGGEPNKDLAVLRIDAPPDSLNPVVVGDSRNLVVGQKVLAIGNPFGLDQTLTTGVISALGREITSVAGTTITDVIQTDASINPGNSGGALLDSSGRLIGVNTSIYSTSGSSAGIGFAVPVNTVKQIVPQLIEHGRVKRAGLGITRLGDDIARRWRIPGVIIRDVIPGGAAEKAGLQSIQIDRFGNVRSMDVIVAIDDRRIAGYDDLYQALDGREVGEEVEVVVRRGDREFPVRLELQELE